MNIENITLNHSITIDEYNDLRASVDFITIRENRARIALNHSLYTLIARENGRPVGMARVVGDGGYVYFYLRCHCASIAPVAGTWTIYY